MNSSPIQGAGQSGGLQPMRPPVQVNPLPGGARVLAADPIDAGISPETVNQVSTRVYDQTPFNPNTSNMTSAQLADAARMRPTLTGLEKIFFRDQTGPLSQIEQQQLEGLSRTLGFRNLEMLQHHLRNLAPEQRQAVLNRIVEKFETEPDYDKAVKGAFQEVFREAIDNMFTAHNPPLPKPVFKAEHPKGDASWDTASLASVFNGLSKIRQETPARFALIARGGPPDSKGENTALQFVRRETPKAPADANIFDRLSKAAMIAHTDCDNCHIFLYDAAVSGDNNKIVNSVVDKLALLSRVDPATNELIPTYHPPSMLASPERNLEKLADESPEAYDARLRDAITSELLQKFGNNDPHRLNEAINYVIRYRRVGTDKLGPKMGIAAVPANARPDGPEVREALRRLGGGGKETDRLLMVICRMEQVDAVAQTQKFLRATLPGGSKIRVDGIIGVETKKMVHAFQASVALNTIKERIEDDPKLSEVRKTQLLGQINQEFRLLGAKPELANQILGRVLSQVNGLLSKRPAEIAAHTAQNLQKDVKQTQALASSVAFSTDTAKYLVDSWLNVMDSGQGLDMGEQLVVHEAGHIWEHQLDNRTNALNKAGKLDVYENWTTLFKDSQAAQGGTAMYQTNTQDYHDQLRDDLSAASDYGATNPREDFAEASRIFTYDPQRLMRRSLIKFLYINALNGNPHSPEDILRMAGECRYSKEDLLGRLNTFLGGQNSKGIRFTIPMSNFLTKAYAPLRKLIGEREVNPNPGTHAPVSPQVSFNPGGQPVKPPQTPDLAPPPMPLPAPIYQTEPIEPSLPAQGGAAVGQSGQILPPATPNQAGWTFEKLADRYKALNLQLQGSMDLGDEVCGPIRQEMKRLLMDFIELGPGQMQGPPDLGPGVASFEKALSSLGFGEDGKSSVKGRAIVAALTISRALGYFDRGEHPEIARHLPESFFLLQREDAFNKTISNPAFSADLQLIGGLKSIHRHEANQSTISKAVASANIYTRQLAEQLAKMRLGTGGLMRLDLAQSSPTVSSIMGIPEVNRLFDSFQNMIGMARSTLNNAVVAINNASGKQYRGLSDQDVMMFLIRTNAMAKGELSGENLLSFLEEREAGRYAINPLDDRLFPMSSRIPNTSS